MCVCIIQAQASKNQGFHPFVIDLFFSLALRDNTKDQNMIKDRNEFLCQCIQPTMLIWTGVTRSTFLHRVPYFQKLKKKEKQEAFRERRHLHVCGF